MINVKKITSVITMAAAVSFAAGIVSNAAYAADGAKVFKKCQTCHDPKFAKNRVGPNLAGVAGKAAAGVDGFKYSSAMKEAAAGGLVWTDENLDKFLTKPKKFMKKTKMSFAGLKDEDDRKAVIEYMKSH